MVKRDARLASLGRRCPGVEGAARGKGVGIGVGLVAGPGLGEVVAVPFDKAFGVRIDLGRCGPALDLVVPDPEVADLVPGRIVRFERAGRAPFQDQQDRLLEPAEVLSKITPPASVIW